MPRRRPEQGIFRQSVHEYNRYLDSTTSRPYRFGYGVLDENLNGLPDAGEKKVYFEFSDYSTSYIFYESPR